MKFSKILTIALAALAVTACSDDDKRSWNTASDVTVEMGQATASFKEGKEAVTIPLVVNGDANGDIRVTLACKESGANPAQEDVHYYMLTKTIVIFPEDKTYDVEMTVLDDDVINDPRTFQVEIVSVEGATVGGQKYTECTIRDNDADFYDKLSGKWTMNTASGAVPVNLVAGDEETAAYNSYYILEGLGQGYVEYQVNYFFDMETQTGHLELPYGQIGGTVNFSDLGAMDVALGGALPDN